MKKSILTIAIATIALTACNNGHKAPTHDELVQEIKAIETPLMEAAQIESIDTAKGNELLVLYTQFADAFPDDPMSATYLHRAAQVAGGMDRIDDMTAYYNRVINNYPDYAKLDECYYEKGIALDNAGRKEEARKAYQEFLDEYPDHFLAEDIRKALPLLDMSDELLLKHLQEMEH